MDTINEQLDSKYGWSSGKKKTQPDPDNTGLQPGHVNDGVLAWVPGVHNVAVMMVPDMGPWLFRLISWPGMSPSWQACEFKGDPTKIPQINSIDDFVAWASTKHYQGLNILDK